jgi:hypothetical protein
MERHQGAKMKADARADQATAHSGRAVQQRNPKTVPDQPQQKSGAGVAASNSGFDNSTTSASSIIPTTPTGEGKSNTSAFDAFGSNGNGKGKAAGITGSNSADTALIDTDTLKRAVGINTDTSTDSTDTDANGISKKVASTDTEGDTGANGISIKGDTTDTDTKKGRGISTYTDTAADTELGISTDIEAGAPPAGINTSTDTDTDTKTNAAHDDKPDSKSKGSKNNHKNSLAGNGNEQRPTKADKVPQDQNHDEREPEQKPNQKQREDENKKSRQKGGISSNTDRLLFAMDNPQEVEDLIEHLRQIAARSGQGKKQVVKLVGSSNTLLLEREPTRHIPMFDEIEHERQSSGSSDDSNSKPNLAADYDSSDDFPLSVSSAHQPEEIPVELADLEQRLRGVPSDDIEQLRRIVSEWLTTLQGPQTMKIVSKHGSLTSRRRKDIQQDEGRTELWVRYLDKTLNPMASNSIHSSAAKRLYGVDVSNVTIWKEAKLITYLRQEKNKVLVDEKELVIAQIINKRFGKRGSRIVSHAMQYFFSIKAEKSA